jgi:hypothetical protein
LKEKKEFSKTKNTKRMFGSVPTTKRVVILKLDISKRHSVNAHHTKRKIHSAIFKESPTVLKERMAKRFAIMVENPGADSLVWFGFLNF